MKQTTIFAFCNQKGGVGKTTSNINLGAGLSQEGYSVLIVDTDPQANATSGLGFDTRSIKSSIYDCIIGSCQIQDTVLQTKNPGLSLVPSTPSLSGAEIELISIIGREFQLKRALESVQGSYDFIFIDCPPSLGLLTVNALAASNLILIPLQCEYYALEGLGQLLHTHGLVKRSLNPSLEIGAVLLTMADFRTKLTEQVISEVRSFFKEKVFDTVIPRSVRLGEAPSFGVPGIVYDKVSKGSKSYLEATQEFIRRFCAEKGPIEEATREPIKEGVAE